MKDLLKNLFRGLHTENIKNVIGLVSGLLCTFLILAYLSGAWKEDNFFDNIFSSMLGAAIVAVITLFLLEGQTRSENEKEQSSAIFRKKLEVYQKFLDTLNGIATKQELSNEDKINLQFQIAQISVHTKPGRLMRISEEVNAIVRKLYVSQPIDNSICGELIRLSVEFHDELYKNKWEAGDKKSDEANMSLDDAKKVFDAAIQNFACLRVPERYEKAYKMLSWLQDSISYYKPKSRIIGYKDLRVKIDIREDIKKDYDITASAVYVVANTDNTLKGSIYLYTDDQNAESLQHILECLQDLLKDSDHLEKVQSMKITSGEKKLLGYEEVKNFGIPNGLQEIKNKDNYLEGLYVTLTILHPLWYEGGIIPQRQIGPDGNEISIISFDTENEDTSTKTGKNTK